MITPDSRSGLEQRQSLIPTDSVSHGLCDISALAAIARDPLQAFDNVIGEQEIHAHTHAHSMAHARLGVNRRLTSEGPRA